MHSFNCIMQNCINEKTINITSLYCLCLYTVLNIRIYILPLSVIVLNKCNNINVNVVASKIY